jgi:hypothetical protein
MESIDDIKLMADIYKMNDEVDKATSQVTELAGEIDKLDSKVDILISQNKMYRELLRKILNITETNQILQNFACSKTCENFKESGKYHLLCRIFRIRDEIQRVLGD